MKNRIFFSDFHPIILFLYFAVQLIITMFVMNPIILILSFCGGLAFLIMISDDRKQIKKDFVFWLVFSLIITISNPIFSQNGVTVLFYIGDFAYTLESLIYGADFSLMVVSVIIWFKNYNLIMSEDKTEYLFGRILPKISMIITLVFRFIPLYKKQIANIRDAQKGMGLYSGNKFKQKLKNAIDVFLSLVTWSMENSVETGMSMKARGYSEKYRTSYSIYRLVKSDYIFFSCFVVLTLFVVSGAFLGSIDFVFFPKISEFDFSPVSILVYMSFAVYSFLPFIFENLEIVRWNYYISKI